MTLQAPALSSSPQGGTGALTSFIRRVRGTGSPAGKAEVQVIEEALKEALRHFYVPVTTQQEDVTFRFRQLFARWRKETEVLSSLSQIVLHSSYQQIIGLGAPAIPLILAELQKEPVMLFPALMAISGTNPVPREHRGNVAAMARDWLQWGRENEYYDSPAPAA